MLLGATRRNRAEAAPPLPRIGDEAEDDERQAYAVVGDHVRMLAYRGTLSRDKNARSGGPARDRCDRRAEPDVDVRFTACQFLSRGAQYADGVCGRSLREPKSSFLSSRKPTGGYSALLPDVPGFFVAGSTIKEIDKETAKALPWYLDYLKQQGREAKPKMHTERQIALTVPSPHEELRYKYIKV